MYVRVWQRNGTVMDRPVTLRNDDDYGVVAEWPSGDPPDGRGTLVVSGSQVFADDGTPMGGYSAFDPPWAIQCEESFYGADDWHFRIPANLVEWPCPAR